MTGLLDVPRKARDDGFGAKEYSLLGSRKDAFNAIAL
jgi:hypothetical protein